MYIEKEGKWMSATTNWEINKIYIYIENIIVCIKYIYIYGGDSIGRERERRNYKKKCHNTTTNKQMRYFSFIIFRLINFPDTDLKWFVNV